jgi:hypothetical protein
MKVNRGFGGTYAENYGKQETSMRQAASRCAGFLLGLCFDLEGGGDIFLRSIRFLRTTWHCVAEDRTVFTGIPEFRNNALIQLVLNLCSRWK